jgi:uncharacterized protein (DUF885 family)
MRTLFRWSLRLSLALTLLVALFVAHSLWFKPLHIRIFFERVFAEYLFENPEMLSSMRILPGWLDWYSDDLADASLAFQDRMREKLANDLDTLRRYDRAALDTETQVSYDMLEYFLQIQQEGDRFRYHNYPLNQLFGLQNGLPTFMATQHQVKSEGDARNYIARLGKFGQKFGQSMEGLKAREDAGIIPPTFVIEKVLDEMRRFVATPARENILYSSFAEKLEKIPAEAMDASTRESLLAEVEAAIPAHVHPAYGLFIAHYETLLPKCRQPRRLGAAGRRGLLRLGRALADHHRHDADAVHQLGLREVERIGPRWTRSCRPRV